MQLSGQVRSAPLTVALIEVARSPSTAVAVGMFQPIGSFEAEAGLMC